MNVITTRSAMVAALIELGMNAVFAKVAVQQQYNYDEGDIDSNNLGGYYDDDLAKHHDQTSDDAIMVKSTWEAMLTIENDEILVDGEPMYDLEGNIL
jgi:hypothetical protein